MFCGILVMKEKPNVNDFSSNLTCLG